MDLDIKSLIADTRENKKNDEESVSVKDILKTLSTRMNMLGTDIKNNTKDVISKTVIKETKSLSNDIRKVKENIESLEEKTKDISDVKQISTSLGEKSSTILEKVNDFFRENKSNQKLKENKSIIQQSIKGISSVFKTIKGIETKSFKEMKKHIDKSVGSLKSDLMTFSNDKNSSILDTLNKKLSNVSKANSKRGILFESKFKKISKLINIKAKTNAIIKQKLFGFVKWIVKPFTFILKVVKAFWKLFKLLRFALFMLSPPGLILMGGLLIAALIYSPKFRDWVIDTLKTGITFLKDKIMEYLPKPIATVLNFLLTTGLEGITGFINFLGELGTNWDNPEWWKTKFLQAVTWVWTKFLEYGKTLKSAIVDPIVKLLNLILPEPVKNVFAFFGKLFNEGLQGLFTFFFELKENWTNWEWWKKNFTGMGQWLLSSFLEYGDLLLKLGAYIRDSILEYIPGLKPFFDFFNNTFQQAIQGAVNFLSELPDNFADPMWWLKKLQGLGDFIIDKFMEWGNLLKDGLFSLLDLIPGVDMKGAAEEFDKLSETEGAGYAAAASVGVALNLRKSDSEIREEFTKLSKAEDIKSAGRMFNTAMSKLKLIEAFSAGYDKAKAINVVNNETQYRADEHIKHGVDNLAEGIWEGKGLHLSTLNSIVWPPKYNGVDIGNATDQMLGIENANSVKRLEGVLNSIKDNFSSAGFNNLEFAPSAGEGVIIPPLSKEQQLALGGIVTEPTRALIGESGDHEAVIPLNEQGISFMKDTLKAALMDMSMEAPSASDSGGRDDTVEKKVDGIAQTITELIKVINGLRPGDQSVMPVGSDSDPINEFNKMIASGVLSNRGGGI
jgi:hypothetical protein